MIPCLFLAPIAAAACAAPHSNGALIASTPKPAAQDAASTAAKTLPLLDHQKLSVAMARLATEHPELVSILPVGTSRGGRKIDALRLAAGERAPGRPAILLVANIDGPWVFTSGLALAHAQKLAASYADDANVRRLLDTTTLYVVPRANPDAAQARFLSPLAEVRASGHGIDNDRDGRSGEDGPADIDDDGLVLTLRVPDPEGQWLPDPADPRVLIEADRARGQRGLFARHVEGHDSDKDESVGEDPEHDAIVNENFPMGWAEHTPGGGSFATDEPETRALCEFVLAHEDIALVLTYGRQDNLVEKPKAVADDAPRVKLIPAEGVPQSDVDLYAEIGRRYKRITKSHAKQSGDDDGSFQAWIQAHRGLWALNAAVWTIPLDDAAGKGGEAAGKTGDTPKGRAGTPKSEAAAQSVDAAREPASTDESAPKASGASATEVDGAEKPTLSDDAKRLRWLEANGESARFVPWRPFDHPELGAVEIGGFAPYATIEPPASEEARLAQVELDFLTSLGDLLPRVKLVDVSAKELSAGLWEVKASLQNDALLPLSSTAGRRAGNVRPARVLLRAPSGAKLLAGDRQTLVRELPGSGGRKELRWLVLGAPPSALTIEVDTDSAGTVQATPEVK